MHDLKSLAALWIRDIYQTDLSEFSRYSTRGEKATSALRGPALRGLRGNTSGYSSWRPNVVAGSSLMTDAGCNVTIAALKLEAALDLQFRHGCMMLSVQDSWLNERISRLMLVFLCLCVCLRLGTSAPKA